MKYIKQLEQERTIMIMRERMAEFRAYLLSDKFAAIQSDMGRGDLISTSDVMNWLRRIEFTDLP